MADRIRNINLSDRAKLGIAGTLAVFVAAFLGATLALALDNDGPGDRGGPQFGLAAASAQTGGPLGQVPGAPGQSQGEMPTPPGAPEGGVPSLPGGPGADFQGSAPGLPGGDSRRGLPTPPGGLPGGRGNGGVQGAGPQFPAIPATHGRGDSHAGNRSQSSNK